MAVADIFVDLDSVVFIQEDGPCSAYAAMSCHAIDSASIGRTEATRIYCKSDTQRGERIVARTVQGRKEPGTLTINAWSQEQSDLLHRLWQNNCMFGAQTHLDVCGLPTDLTAYTKILDYYGIVPGNLDYSNIDNLEGGEGTGLMLALSCTYDDLIEVVKVQLRRVDQTVITDTVHMMTISGDPTRRCSSEMCGAPQDSCQTLTAYTTTLVGPLTANCWYSTDGGTTWAQAGADPLATSALTNTLIASTIIGDRWLVFPRGGTAGFGGLCAYSDDSGVSWTEIDMGGTAAADYVDGCYQHSAGNLWVCGGEDGTPSGHVWFSSDRGESWTFFEDIATLVLRDIATADGVTVYTVGDTNTMRKTTDGGTTWTTITGPATGAFNLNCVRALTNDHVLVGSAIDNDDEQLWCSLDGGSTWTAQTFTGSSDAATSVVSISLAPNAPKQHVWIVQLHDTPTNARAVFRSLDGGHNWERFFLDNDGYFEIFACSSNHAWIAGMTDAAQGGTATVVEVYPVA